VLSSFFIVVGPASLTIANSIDYSPILATKKMIYFAIPPLALGMLFQTLIPWLSTLILETGTHLPKKWAEYIPWSYVANIIQTIVSPLPLIIFILFTLFEFLLSFAA